MELFRISIMLIGLFGGAFCLGMFLSDKVREAGDVAEEAVMSEIERLEKAKELHRRVMKLQEVDE
jgi:hypothetical protein